MIRVTRLKGGVHAREHLQTMRREGLSQFAELRAFVVDDIQPQRPAVQEQRRSVREKARHDETEAVKTWLPKFVAAVMDDATHRIRSDQQNRWQRRPVANSSTSN